MSDIRAHPFTATTHPIHVLTLVVAPLKLIGGTASMVNPIAIF